MAIEVTKVGQIPGKREWVGRCHHCGTEARCLEEDLTNITHDQREGSFSWERCPVCKREPPTAGLLFYPKGGRA